MEILKYLIAILASSTVLSAVILKYSELRKIKLENRAKFIKESKKFMQAVSLIPYESLGDFRKDAVFLSIYTHLKKATRMRVDELILDPKITSENYLKSKEDCLACLEVIKLEIAYLEKKWLLN